MELRQLKYFLTVADARSIVSAANSLFISRQAVSKAISQLEDEIGVELFMRGSNGAFLTPAGVMFYDRIRNNVTELEQIKNEMQQYGARYHQRIRLTFSIGSLRLCESELLAFKSGQENVDISYQEQPEENCLKALLDHKADLSVCTSKPEDPLLISEPILTSPYGLLVREQENLSFDEQIDFQDLKWLPLASLSEPQTQTFIRRHKLSIQHSGHDLYRLLALTQSGKCALILPQILVPRQWPGFCWIPFRQTEYWTLYRVFLQSLESNILYRTALDDLQIQVFDQIQRGEQHERYEKIKYPY